MCWIDSIRSGRSGRNGDLPVPTEIADAARPEAMAICRGAPWRLRDAGDHGIGIKGSQPADERDRILIGAFVAGRGAAAPINLSERAALPAQGEARRGLVALDFDNDFLEQRPHSSFRSRGVVVAACQTAARSAPSASRRPRSSWESALDAPLRGGKARPWRPRARSSAPPIRARGPARPTGCRDRRRGSGVRRGLLRSLPGEP